MCVELTEKAANEIKAVVRQQELDEKSTWLRVCVDGFGNRRTFTLDLSDHQEPGELLVESHGVPVVFARDSQPRLNGVKIDFLEVGGQRGFVFDAPAVQKGTAPGKGDPMAPMPNEEQVREVLHGVIDPEVGVNVVDLGLVYGIEISGQQVHVRMTMTTPACPLSEHITNEATSFITSAYPAVQNVEVEIVWEPAWGPHMISEAARKQLGWGR